MKLTVSSYIGVVNASGIRPSSTVPFPKDFKFVNRDIIISEVDAIFRVPNRHNRAALYGLGGIGYIFQETGYLQLLTTLLGSPRLPSNILTKSEVVPRTLGFFGCMLAV
jgi:hypothetical protein